MPDFRPNLHEKSKLHAGFRYYISFLGLAIARAQRKWAQASDLCETAVQLNPKEIQFHLNIAKDT